MKKIVFFILLAYLPINAIFAQSESFGQDFWSSSKSLEDAQKGSSSEDAQTLKEAGMYYFLSSTKFIESKSNSKQLLDYAKQASSIFEKLYNTNKSDSKYLTLYGMSLLNLGGLSQSVGDKMKHSTRGISLLDQAIRLTPNNLDVLYTRVVSFSPVPVYFKDLRDIVIKDAENFLKLQDDTDKTKEQIVRVYLASTYYDKKNKDKAAEVLKDFDRNYFETQVLKGNESIAKAFAVCKKML